MTEPKKPCGPHVELAKNDSARITRCACGAVHLHLIRSGVTVQLADEHWAEVLQAIDAARAPLAPSAPEPNAVRGSGELVSVRIVPVAPPKKPSLN